VLRGFLAAVEFLTVVPVPGKVERAPGDPGCGAWAFPLIGLGIGAILVVLDRGLPRLFPEPVVTALVVTVWVGLTGGLHLDGLADALDGLGGGWGREQSLAIMRDGRLGSYGVIGIVLALILLAAAVFALQRVRTAGLLLAPTLGRLAPLLLARLCPPARPNGLGFDFARALSRNGFTAGLIIAGTVGLVLLGWWGVVVLAWVCALAALSAWYLTRRLGGMTGDLLGASVAGAELFVVLFLLALEHLGLH
jgi:adenosylcobinamide-GDP ribazoletransferase